MPGPVTGMSRAGSGSAGCRRTGGGGRWPAGPGGAGVEGRGRREVQADRGADAGAGDGAGCRPGCVGVG